MALQASELDRKKRLLDGQFAKKSVLGQATGFKATRPADTKAEFVVNRMIDDENMGLIT